VPAPSVRGADASESKQPSPKIIARKSDGTRSLPLLPAAFKASAAEQRSPWDRVLPGRTLSALDYAALQQASAPDLSDGAPAAPAARPLPGGPGGASPAVSSPRVSFLAASGGGLPGFGVQRSAASASVLLGGGVAGARAVARAVRRSPSMHERMRSLVHHAKARSQSGHAAAAVATAAAAAAGGASGPWRNTSPPQAPGGAFPPADLVTLR
jgi:hypothetical protein